MPRKRTRGARVISPSLEESFLAVLRLNDLGDSTKPSPRLYPHQWSWDSVFVALALALHDPSRALKELETLFNAQWTDGRVPHIVFNLAAADYFPGPDLWNCFALTDLAPEFPPTSGMVQPPVHSIAVWDIAKADSDNILIDRIKVLYAKLFAWHRYLMTARDPEEMGLITIYHPWESGMDNSPRWDSPLARVVVGDLPAYERRDTKHVGDASERPTNPEYDRFLWLVESMKTGHYDDLEIYRTHPFLVKDTFMSAIFALANDALAKLAVHVNAPEEEQALISSWQQRVVNGIIEHAWNEEKGLTLDLDIKDGFAQIDVSTCAGLAPILVPGCDRKIVERVAEHMFDADFAGAPMLGFAVVPSTSPGSVGFHPRGYWRGPSWPIINWLLWFGLRLHGFKSKARRLLWSNLSLLARPKARSGEYFELERGQQLGSGRPVMDCGGRLALVETVVCHSTTSR